MVRFVQIHAQFGIPGMHRAHIEVDNFTDPLGGFIDGKPERLQDPGEYLAAGGVVIIQSTVTIPILISIMVRRALLRYFQNYMRR